MFLSEVRALLMSAVFYRSEAHATRAIRDETPKETPKKKRFISQGTTRRSHGLPANREQVAGVRGCCPKAGGYAVATGPADGHRRR
jgi:hypothetical protein